MTQEGYIDYFAVLKLPAECKPGEVRKEYKRLMKDLLIEIARVEITPARRDKYLLDMAQLNAAFYILRDNELREKYVQDRNRVMELEDEWRAAVEKVAPEADGLRRKYDGAVRHFLSTYMEELVLEAGRDPECVEASNWDPAHERHASRVLRHYRQRQYQAIHERLPYVQITKPEIDWAERGRTAALLIAGDY
jgi:curved DNA-binding protein CbpA